MKGPFQLGLCATALLVCFMIFVPITLSGEERLVLELYGGAAYIKADDLNQLSEAEQQYNDIYLVQHLSWMQGGFSSDFPRVNWNIPVGLRVKYRLTSAFSLSLGIEGFTNTREKSVQGTFSYTYGGGQYESHTKTYDPFGLKITAYSIMGGVHYRLSLGAQAHLDLGVAGGWARSEFEIKSAWTYTAAYFSSTRQFTSLDGGTLEGTGSGDGFMGRAMLQLNQSLSRRFGIFFETAYTLCRLKSIQGTGREIRSGIPGESEWEGPWGIKKEEIDLPWTQAEVFVPTNFWKEWVASQWERDFVLDLSGFQFVVGIQLKF